MGNQVPEALDDAFVRPGTVTPVILSGNSTVANLLVAESSDVFTGNFRLRAVDRTTIEQRFGAGNSAISIGAAGELDSVIIDIREDGFLVVFGGLVDSGDLRIFEGGELRGHGTVQVSSDLVNNGVISAILDGTATFEQELLTLLDLDGTTTDAATLDATILFFSGDLLVDGLGIIDATAILEDPAVISVPGASDTLRLNGTTSYRGNTLSGGGRAIQNGSAFVDENTIIQVATFDGTWDIDGGTLSVATNWRLDGGMDLNQDGTPATLLGAGVWKFTRPGSSTSTATRWSKPNWPSAAVCLSTGTPISTAT